MIAILALLFHLLYSLLNKSNFLTSSLLNKFSIVLNLALIHVPVYLIEYVIYHELTHFIHMNHQSGFHKHLQKYVENENVLRKELNKYKADYE